MSPVFYVRIFYIMACVILTVAQAKGGIISFSNDVSGKQMATSCDHFIDSTQSLSLQDITRPSYTKRFVPFNESIPNFEFLEANIWVRFRVANLTNQPVYLHIPYPYFHQLSLFSPTTVAGNFTESQTGEFLPFSHREIQTNSYNFQLNVLPGDTLTYYMKANSYYVLSLPIQFVSLKYLLEESHPIDLTQGMYFGIVLVMMLYNLFVYFTVKDSSYLWYVIYTFGIGMLNAIIQHLTFEYFYPSIPLLNNYGIIVPATASLFAIAFSYTFLNIKRIFPKLIYLLAIPGSLLVICIILCLFGYRRLANFFVMSGSLTIPVVLIIVGVGVYLKGFKPAFYYLIAWGGFLVTAMVYLLSSLAIIPSNYFTTNAMEYGSAAEMVLLSLALADKINYYKKQSAEAQAALFQSELALKEQLEVTVANRTAEINQTKEQLHEAFEELQAANINLENVVHNRTVELEETNQELKNALSELDMFLYRSAHDLRGPVARLKGLAQLALKNPPTENANEYLVRMAENALDMEKVLHKFSLLNQINMEEPLVKICPKDIAANAVQSFLPVIQSKHMDVLIEGGEEPIMLGKDALYTIIFVSLENAINFTKSDLNELPRVVIKIFQEPHLLKIQIYDNGIGIKDNIRDEIFNMYFRGSELSKGNGLGLYVSRKAVEKLKGSIYVESKEGKYSKFTYTIPL